MMRDYLFIAAVSCALSLLFATDRAKAQEVDVPELIAVYHPLMTNEPTVPTSAAQNEAVVSWINDSRDVHTVCEYEVCIKTAPNPYGPVASTIDYGAEQAFLAYVQASIEIDQCPEKSCAEAAVQRIPGVVRDLEAVSDTPSQ